MNSHIYSSGRWRCYHCSMFIGRKLDHYSMFLSLEYHFHWLWFFMWQFICIDLSLNREHKSRISLLGHQLIPYGTQVLLAQERKKFQEAEEISSLWMYSYHPDLGRSATSFNRNRTCVSNLRRPAPGFDCTSDIHWRCCTPANLWCFRNGRWFCWCCCHAINTSSFRCPWNNLIERKAVRVFSSPPKHTSMLTSKNEHVLIDYSWARKSYLKLAYNPYSAFLSSASKFWNLRHAKLHSSRS